MANRKRLLVVSNMFPCLRHPTSCVFFANLLLELASLVDDITVLSSRPWIPKFARAVRPRWRKWYLDPPVSRLRQVKVIRPHLPEFPGSVNYGLNGHVAAVCLGRLASVLAKTRHFDAVLGYNALPDGITAVVLGRKLGVPAIVCAIGTDINEFASQGVLNSMFLRGALRNAAAVLANSHALEERIRVVAGTRVSVRTFYKGVAVSRFRDLRTQPELRRALDLRTDREYLLFVGRLIRSKGVGELVHAFAMLVNQFPSLDLVLVGEPLEFVSVRRELSRLGVEGRVHFRGLVSYSEMPKYMKAADLLVLPTWAEGLPNVVLEAMAAGLPVVATAVGGIPEVVRNEVTGLLVEPRSPERLATAITRMLVEPQLRERCTANARELVLRDFDVRKNAHVLLGILEQLCRGKPTHPAKTNAGEGQSARHYAESVLF
jgi:glycosyltransferase involved in cell wall biosynthesis